MQSGIQFFPLDVNTDTKLALIECEFGIKGFAVIVKLWQKIYGEEGYYNVLVFAPPVLTKEPLDWPEELDGGVTGIVGILQDEMIE